MEGDQLARLKAVVACLAHRFDVDQVGISITATDVAVPEDRPARGRHCVCICHYGFLLRYERRPPVAGRRALTLRIEDCAPETRSANLAAP